jgi:hypothetical protein
MDRLSTRYADPFILLDGYIATSQFTDFIEFFSKQQIEDDRWEFFLHRVWDKTFDDFQREMQTAQDLQGMSDEQSKAIVEESMKILGKFTPKEGGE